MPRTDTAERTIAAPIPAVFEALIDPVALLAWLPPSGMTGKFERFDASPGGSYRLVLTHNDPAAASGKATRNADVVDGRFVEITTDARVVQAVNFVSDDPAYAGTMIMTWAVEEAPGGTRVRITADDVPDGISAEDHAVGLASSLTNLAEYLA